jgi:hypothetical protein
MIDRDDLQLDGFETRLLTELKAEVETRATHAQPVTVPTVTRGHRRRWYVPVTGAAAAAAVGIALVVTVARPTPAYAVTGSSGEDITVTVTRLEGADALQAALRERGVPADVQYLPTDTKCLPGRYTAVNTPGLSLQVGSDLFAVTIPAGAVGQGDTFVLSAAVAPTNGGVHAIVNFDVAHGAVGPCQVVPAS